MIPDKEWDLLGHILVRISFTFHIKQAIYAQEMTNQRTSDQALAISRSLVLLMSMFAAALRTPHRHIEATSPLEPELADIFGPRRDPRVRLARAPGLFTRNVDTLTCKQGHHWMAVLSVDLCNSDSTLMLYLPYSRIF